MLINAKDLLANFDQYKIIDLRSKAEYDAAHIKGAVSLHAGDAPFKIGAGFPSDVQWAMLLGSRGVGNDAKIVAYDDGASGRAVARFWYIAKHYGHEDVFILNGGLHVSADLPLTTDVPEIIPAIYTINTTLNYIIGKDGILANFDEITFLDVRSPEEFAGTDLRDNPRGGHLRGAISVVMDNFFADMPGQSFASPEKLAQTINNLGVRKEDFIVTYWQLGVRAAVAGLALRNAGFENVQIYEGSIYEWSRNLRLELVPGMDDRIIQAASADDGCG